MARWIGLFLSVGCTNGEADDVGPLTGDTGDEPPPECAASWTDGLDGPSFAKPDGELVLNNDPSYPYLLGTFSSGPPLELHHETERSGSCRLLRYTPSTCDPGCAPGTELCVDGACAAFPARLDAGTLTVDLDGDTEVLDPDGTTSYFAEVAGPAVGAVEVEATGGDLPAFSATTCAVAPVVPAGDWDALVHDRVPGADVTLSWGEPWPGGRIALRMVTGVGTHGGISHAEIECEGPDTGSLTIDGGFLDTLYAEGWGCGECGTNIVYRYRSGSAEVGGPDVRFTARAGTPFFHIPGRNF